MGSQVYSVATLAEHWGCGTDTVYALIKSGDLPAFKLGGKLLRVRHEEVERYECQSLLTPSNDTAESSRSSGTRMADAADIRLARQISHRPKQKPASSGSAAPLREG